MQLTAVLTRYFLTVIIILFLKIFEIYYKDDLQHEGKILENRLSIVEGHRVQSSLPAPLCYSAVLGGD